MNGERIKLARKRCGLSLRDLARKMDHIVTAQAIGKYERNEMTPSSEVLISLTRALDVSLAYLMAPQAVELGEVEFRTKTNTSARDRAKVETAVLESVERYLQIERILELDSAAWSRPDSMPVSIAKAEQAETLADEAAGPVGSRLRSHSQYDRTAGGKRDQGPYRRPPREGIRLHLHGSAQG